MPREQLERVLLLPAATSFCIELRENSLGIPSSAVRIAARRAASGPLGYPDGTGLINALLQACPPACVRPDSPSEPSEAGGRQCKRCQEAELAPEHGCLVISALRIPPLRHAVLRRGLRSLPRCRIRRDLHISKRQERCLNRAGPACSASKISSPGARYLSRSRRNDLRPLAAAPRRHLPVPREEWC